MNKEKSKTSLIIKAYIAVSILTTLYFIVVSRAVADYKFKVGDTLKFKGLLTSFLSLLTNRKQQLVFFILELCILLILGYLLYMYLHQPKKFTSNIVEITPKIHIPAPAGEGQFGSKWFMEENEKRKVFAVNTVDLDDKRIQNLISTGDEDIRNEIDKLNKGVPITEIENEINNKNKIEKEKIEKEFFDTEYMDEFENFIENDDEFYNGINLLANNEDLLFENYENSVELENEFLSKQIANEIKEKNEQELKNQKPYNPKEDKFKFFEKGGLITGYYVDEKHNKEYILYNEKDTHSVSIGMTRSGKSRCLVLQTIENVLFAGESAVVSDPKGELYTYSASLAKKLGYEVICIDFKNPKFSNKYNLLQPIINAAKKGDIDLAVDYSNELANMLVKETKGDNPMWTDNAKTLISGVILSLVLLNKNEEYQNMANVHRIVSMTKNTDIINSNTDCDLFIKALQKIDPSNPIINAFIGINGIAKDTYTGFSTNATSALQLFSQPSMWDMTHTTDVDITKMGERKQILYIILPDENTTYYKIAAIIVKQLYNELVKICDNVYGGRLPIRVNFILDEFGNFTAIPEFETLLTVAGGRGIRFNIFIQAFAQLVKKYDKETANTIKSNCETTIYLKAGDTDTLKEISELLGSYTIYSNSESMNIQNSLTTSSSSSQSLQKRSLLLPEEVKAIERPYLLVINGSNPPAMNIAPDISKLSINKMYGMGDESHNNKLRMIRDRKRKLMISDKKATYWDLFGEIKAYCQQNIDPTRDLDGNLLKKPRQIGTDEIISHVSKYIKGIMKEAA